VIPFVAMTGGLACGKSTAAESFERLGVTVIDTDEVARWLTGVDGRAVGRVKEAFGDSMMNPDGSLARDKMRQLVFTQPESLTKLEDILHPMVKEESILRMEKAEGAYGVLVVPLLFETGYYLEHSFTSLTIEAPLEAQMERILSKGWTREEAEGAIRRQYESQLRREHADVVVDNDGTIEELDAKVTALDGKFRVLFRET